MTVKELKKQLEKCNDDDVVIIDYPDWFVPSEDNEVVNVLYDIKNGYGQASHTIVLQTESDIG